MLISRNHRDNFNFRFIKLESNIYYYLSNTFIIVKMQLFFTNKE